MSVNQATIRTYASSANFLGIYDHAGIKVSGHNGSGLYIETTASKSRMPGLQIQSTGSVSVPTDSKNLAHKIAASLFSDYNNKIDLCESGLILTINNNLKKGGLGTSAASAVAFVELLDKLYELKLTPEQKIFYASLAEPDQHLDNVLPCVLGGIVFSYRPEDGQSVPYHRFAPPSNLFPVLIVPLDIKKVGGTQGAKNAIKYLVHTADEKQRISKLKESAIQGVTSSDFQVLRKVAIEFLSWKRSETFLRNQERVYGVDIIAINRFLEKRYGRKVIFTPSGAGPAALVQAEDPDTANRAAEDVADDYRVGFHNALVVPASIRNQGSIDDFV